MYKRQTEFFADTSELYQLLKKGHHGVEMPPEDWNRLVTWLDMNAPYLGEWPGERNEGLLKRRYDLHRQFSGAERNYVTMKDSLFRRNASGVIVDGGKSVPRASEKSVPVPEPRNETLAVDLGEMCIRDSAGRWSCAARATCWGMRKRTPNAWKPSCWPFTTWMTSSPVSYTHLDVYKRQTLRWVRELRKR